MLGKLLKYEMKSTARIFLPLYGCIVVFAAIVRAFMQINTGAGSRLLNILSGLSVFLYVAIIISTFVITLIVLIQRFYRNLLGDEGYLMHTLPVRTRQQIGAKLIAASTWVLFAIIVVIISVLVLVISPQFISAFGELLTGRLGDMLMKIGASDIAVFIELAIMIFLSLVCGILIIYTSIAVGSLFNKNRIGAAFIAFIAINFGLNLLSSCVMLLASSINIFSLIPGGSAAVHIVLACGICFNILISAAAFFATNYILKRRLNLQ
ncbi:MAG: hypothetical protein RSC43_05015 [Clostridia bacterium]